MKTLNFDKKYTKNIDFGLYFFEIFYNLFYFLEINIDYQITEIQQMQGALEREPVSKNVSFLKTVDISRRPFFWVLNRNYNKAMISHFSFQTMLLGRMVRSLCYGYHREGRKSSRQIVITPPPPPTLKERTMKVYEGQPELDLVEEVLKLPLKQFSVKVHHLVVAKERSSILWANVEKSFLDRLKPTTNQTVIRSYAKILYALSKSKQASGNYQTKMSLLLPFSTRQSFTTIVTALSRIAPLSTEFSYIVQKLYHKRRGEFNPRELVSINYTLANNGRPIDTSIIEVIDQLNCVQTITMLRSYDLSNSLTPALLTRIFKKLKYVRDEFNILDLSDFINIFLKHKYQGESFDQMVEEGYEILKRNVDEVSFQKIWQFVPESVNEHRLRIGLVEELVETIQILRKSRKMGEVSWKRVSATFKDIDNIELKVKLQKIY